MSRRTLKYARLVMGKRYSFKTWDSLSHLKIQFQDLSCRILIWNLVPEIILNTWHAFLKSEMRCQDLRCSSKILGAVQRPKMQFLKLLRCGNEVSTLFRSCVSRSGWYLMCRKSWRYFFLASGWYLVRRKRWRYFCLVSGWYCTWYAGRAGGAFPW